ncbi:MAG: hypothetical protein GIW99_01785 [Candidatus Eremiobacteraeota bacterium]|nr:hypothetical protein [Candidatus Eremiobacteraeota bacterium]MBC5826408.1 hypothetical protein [Candidatus Eremiobacteraeota bacterium]
MIMAALGSAASAADMPAVGHAAPNAKARSVADGKISDFDLATATAKQPVVLYFFPEAFTPG